MSAQTDARLSSHQFQERLRSEGVHTVSKLLQEAHAENRILKDRNAQLEKSVDSLNSRLQRAGLSDQTTHSMSQDEVPPISRKLVEGILRENTMLKQQVSQPQKVEELTMHVYSLQNLVQSLKQERKTLQDEIGSLKLMFHQSDNDKDNTILRLRTELKDCQNQYHIEQDTRLMLTNEIEKLKETLSDTARRCLNVSNRLPSLMTSSEPDDFSSHQVKNMSQILDDNRELKRQCDLLERELSEAKLHLSQLRGGRAPTSRLEQLSQENDTLKKELVEREKVISKLNEMQQILQHQLEAYRGDLRNEASDRTTKRHTDLEPQRAKTSAGNSTVSPSAGDSRPVVRAQQKPTHTASKSSQQRTRLAVLSSTAADSRLVQPAADNISLSSQTDVVRPKMDTRNKSQLACYKCGKQYSKETHSDLVDHLNICKGTRNKQ